MGIEEKTFPYLPVPTENLANLFLHRLLVDLY